MDTLHNSRRYAASRRITIFGSLLMLAVTAVAFLLVLMATKSLFFFLQESAIL